MLFFKMKAQQALKSWLVVLPFGYIYLYVLCQIITEREKKNVNHYHSIIIYCITMDKEQKFKHFPYAVVYV